MLSPADMGPPAPDEAMKTGTLEKMKNKNFLGIEAPLNTTSEASTVYQHADISPRISGLEFPVRGPETFGPRVLRYQSSGRTCSWTHYHKRPQGCRCQHQKETLGIYGDCCTLEATVFHIHNLKMHFSDERALLIQKNACTHHTIFSIAYSTCILVFFIGHNR